MTMEVRRATGPLTASPVRAAEAAVPAAAAGGHGAAAAPQGPAENVEAHTQRLAAEAGGDMGALPWEEAGAAPQQAAQQGGGTPSAQTMQRDAQRVQRTGEDVRKAVERYRTLGQERNLTGAGAIREMAAQDRAKDAQRLTGPFDPSKFSGTARIESGMRAVGLAQSVPALGNSIAALADGATTEELTAVARNAVDTVRNADAAVRAATNGRDMARLAVEHGGRIGGAIAQKLNPVLTVTSAATTVVDSGRALMNNHRNMSAGEIVSHTARIGAAVADVVGVGFPPARLVGAGLGLIAMAADYFSGKKG